jgi:hypothetical protein
MSDKLRSVETMAGQWQLVKPADFANATDFCLRLGRIDRECIFKLVDGGVAIFFSDGSSYRMPKARAALP